METQSAMLDDRQMDGGIEQGGGEKKKERREEWRSRNNYCSIEITQLKGIHLIPNQTPRI